MFTANRDPDRDRAAIEALTDRLDGVTARRFVLISSIAVLADFAGRDVEGTDAFQEDLAYGRHRRALEAFCEDRFDNCLVVRLPALFGPGLRKNFIFDLMNPVRKHVAEIGARLHRKLRPQAPVCSPVDAVLTGRRNNPPEPGIRPLAVYNPIHYQELPELFMDFICSLTGKSPSTTGAGSEGALTKGPFNALRPTADLNNALVSFILTGYHGFSSSAGYVGPHVRVDHDISLLVPEIWARIDPGQRDPAYLIEHGYLEPLEDFQHDGKMVLASRLGYRITEHFVHGFLGKIFDNPQAVFTEEILKPETQGLDVFVDGINNIVEAQQGVAQRYLDDGSIEDACPPLQALLHIMATGEYRGMDAHHPDLRVMFTRDYLFNSDWYHERLKVKQLRDIELWKRHVSNLQTFLDDIHFSDEAERLGIAQRFELGHARGHAFHGDAHAVRPAEEIASLSKEGDQAKVTIQDNGPGIPADDLPHIFERFYRSDQSRNMATGGNGLGLSIVQKIVDGHHGRIEVESELGKGSTFRLILPH